MVQLALMNRFVTPQQVEEITREQQDLADRGIDRSVWFLLLDRGYVSDAQARNLRKHISSSSIRALEVDGYVLQGRIGSGGMGDVFRARNAAGDEAAVKLLSSKISSNPEHARRFQREARAGLRLVHPHITRSLSAGEMEEQRYLIMELVKGPSLKQYIHETGKMSEADALVMIWQIASALGYAWSHGVLHRDIKPGNLMLAPARPGLAEPFCAKVCDFGLAKVWQQPDDDQESKGKLTATNMALGTPHYMAPEQASGDRDLDQRADIYSLGASVFHAVLAKTMHSGKSSTVIMYKQVTEAVDLSPLRTLGTSPGMIKLLGKMVERNRKHRIADWSEMQAAVKLIAPEMVAQQEAAYAQAQQANQVRDPPPKVIEITTAAPASPPARSVVSSSSQAQAHPSVQPPSRRMWHIGILMGLLTLLAAPVVLLLIAQPAGHRVTPASFGAMLVALQGKPHADLVLDPGEYSGPWCFGAAHTGMTIRAAGPGVRVVINSHAGDVAVVQLEPGLRDFRLSGVELVGTGAVSIEAMPGSRATLQDLQLPGALAVSGAEVSCTGVDAQGGVQIDVHGHLLMEDSQLHGCSALSIHEGRCELHRCRISGRERGHADAALVQVSSGSLELDAVQISGERSEAGALPAVGLDLAPGVACVLRDVQIDEVEVGMHSDAASVSAIDGLTLHASTIGMQWSGLRDPAWTWTRLSVSAPQILRGDVKLTNGADGARAERLAQVPSGGDKRR